MLHNIMGWGEAIYVSAQISVTAVYGSASLALRGC